MGHAGNAHMMGNGGNAHRHSPTPARAVPHRLPATALSPPPPPAGTSRLVALTPRTKGVVQYVRRRGRCGDVGLDRVAGREGRHTGRQAPQGARRRRPRPRGGLLAEGRGEARAIPPPRLSICRSRRSRRCAWQARGGGVPGSSVASCPGPAARGAGAAAAGGPRCSCLPTHRAPRTQFRARL